MCGYYEKSPAVERWFEDKVTQLLSGECNPENPENFIEALDNADTHTMARIAQLLKQRDAAALGDFLLGVVEMYWEEKASQIAEDIWEEEAEESRDYAACCYAAEHCVPGFI